VHRREAALATSNIQAPSQARPAPQVNRSESPSFIPPRPDRKKRTKPVERCSSPSHFAVSNTELQRFGPPSIRELPSRKKVDSVLSAVANMYYSPKEVTSDKQSVLVDTMYDKSIYSTIDCLMSPLRKTDVWGKFILHKFFLAACSI
jgi:hypothetical protein